VFLNVGSGLESGEKEDKEAVRNEGDVKGKNNKQTFSKLSDEREKTVNSTQTPVSSTYILFLIKLSNQSILIIP
jgi:hypothetical protein